MEEQKKIIFVDASLLRGNSTCMRRTWRMAKEGYRGKVNYVDVEYGSAFHKFAQAFIDSKGNHKEAMDAAIKYFTTTPWIPKPKKDWMDLQHLKKTCFDWAMWWEQLGDNLEPIRVDGMNTTELVFDLPYYSTTNYEIHLAGTMDRLNKARGAQSLYVILDYKTTSSWDRKDYLRQYALDPQLLFYILAIRKYALLYPDSIYGQMVRQGVGACIEGIFVSSNKEAIIERTDIKFPKAQELDQFETILQKFIIRLGEYLEAGELPLKEGIVNGACNGSKWRCPYFDACAAPDNIAESFILQKNFIQKTYDPREFR